MLLLFKLNLFPNGHPWFRDPQQPFYADQQEAPPTYDEIEEIENIKEKKDKKKKRKRKKRTT